MTFKLKKEETKFQNEELSLFDRLQHVEGANKQTIIICGITAVIQVLTIIISLIAILC